MYCKAFSKTKIGERTLYKQFLFHVPSFLAIERFFYYESDLRDAIYVFVFMTK